MMARRDKVRLDFGSHYEKYKTIIAAARLEGDKIRVKMIVLY